MNLPKITAKKIKDLKIQGAKAIAAASLNCLKKYAAGLKNASPTNFNKKIRQAIGLLKQARPTEPLNQNFLNYLAKQPLKAKTFIKSIEGLEKLLLKAEQATVKNGLKIIKAKQNIFTHCHSGTVEKLLKAAKQSGKKFKVYNTETRPLFQGRITAQKLSQAGINITTLVDSAAAYTISDKSGDKIKINLVLLGADVILPDGSVINKIGSFGISLAAQGSKIPLYIVAELLRFAPGGKIPLEIRSSQEVWPNKPKNDKIINFAFDKVPAKAITGFICEFGVIKPSRVKQYFKKHYLWLK
ncbi:MAG: translation initiation factor eIF-2B [Candidatus Komeilibacteria bacterium]|nr:translation initiation factor eIF-2B [Candidatus Komeilibacteria bacterium]